MKKFIKENIKVVVAFIVGILVSTTGVIAATILSGTEVSYTGNKVKNASNIQQAIDNLYTKASSGSDCRNGYQKQSEDSSVYSCARTARQCSGDNCIVCIRAERLHTETCNQTANYCSSDGYAAGSTITYGNESTTSGVLNTGDAFDCDVNGDGTYDSNNERFYYVSTKTNGITTDSNIAVLVYYSHTISGVPSTSGSKWYSSSNTGYGPTYARDNLPTESQWSNVQITQTIRDITYENNTVRISNFSYEGYATRLLTYQEVNQGCYDGTKNITSTGGISNKCKFLLEKTSYATSGSEIAGGSWLETPCSSDNRYPWFVNAYYSRINSNGSTSGTNIGVRPAIEVQLSEIEY